MLEVSMHGTPRSKKHFTSASCSGPAQGGNASRIALLFRATSALKWRICADSSDQAVGVNPAQAQALYFTELPGTECAATGFADLGRKEKQAWRDSELE